MKDEDYFQIRTCKYTDTMRIRLRMKKIEVYMLMGSRWEYKEAFDTKLEAQQYVKDRISKFPKR